LQGRARKCTSEAEHLQECATGTSNKYGNNIIVEDPKPEVLTAKAD
jgi:hypothetical protein